MAAYRQVHDSRHLQAMRQDMVEFWDAVASAELYANDLHLAADR